MDECVRSKCNLNIEWHDWQFVIFLIIISVDFISTWEFLSASKMKRKKKNRRINHLGRGRGRAFNYFESRKLITCVSHNEKKNKIAFDKKKISVNVTHNRIDNKFVESKVLRATVRVANSLCNTNISTAVKKKKNKSNIETILATATRRSHSLFLSFSLLYIHN